MDIFSIYNDSLSSPLLHTFPGTTTMRQTNVVVIPNCSELSEFKTFDNMVQAINMARRNARDFNFKKEETDNKDWV